MSFWTAQNCFGAAPHFLIESLWREQFLDCLRFGRNYSGLKNKINQQFLSSSRLAGLFARVSFRGRVRVRSPSPVTEDPRVSVPWAWPAGTTSLIPLLLLRMELADTPVDLCAVVRALFSQATTRVPSRGDRAGRRCGSKTFLRGRQRCSMPFLLGGGRERAGELAHFVTHGTH